MSAVTRLQTGFVLAIVLLSLNILLPLFSSHRVEQLRGNYEATEQVRSQLQLLLSALKDGETGQRGFTITGREDFLTPLYQGFGDVDELLLQLQTELKHDSELGALLQTLQPLIAEQRNYFNEVIQLRRRMVCRLPAR